MSVSHFLYLISHVIFNSSSAFLLIRATVTKQQHVILWPTQAIFFACQLTRLLEFFLSLVYFLSYFTHYWFPLSSRQTEAKRSPLVAVNGAEKQQTFHFVAGMFTSSSFSPLIDSSTGHRICAQRFLNTRACWWKYKITDWDKKYASPKHLSETTNTPLAHSFSFFCLPPLFLFQTIYLQH